MPAPKFSSLKRKFKCLLLLNLLLLLSLLILILTLIIILVVLCKSKVSHDWGDMVDIGGKKVDVLNWFDDIMSTDMIESNLK